MKRLLVSILSVAIAFPLAADAKGPFEGTWVGELHLDAVILRLVFTISSSADGPSATMDSPDQGAAGIPVSRVTVVGSSIVMEVKTIGGSYAGTLSADGASIDGIWSQSSQQFPVLLRKNDGPFTLNRPQEPRPPFPYTSTEVTFPDQKAGVVLAGTLTVPPGPGPFPTVVLVAGSGPLDRDEQLMGHKPFLVIADYLSRNGIEVLRYDERGVGKSKGSFAAATTLDFADDAEAAVAFLSSRSEVDASRLGICGHSQGAIVAPLVAARNKSVHFIVVLAGPGVRGDELLLQQNAALARASGADEKRVAALVRLNRAIYDAVIQEGDLAERQAKVTKIFLDSIDSDPTLSEAAKSEARKGLDKVLAEVSTPWLRNLLTLDPGAALATLRIPVLALTGSKDLQVLADPNLAAIKAALDKAGNTSYRVVKLDGLNHLFQHAKTGLPSEYGTITETFAPEALAAIKDFILDNGVTPCSE